MKKVPRARDTSTTLEQIKSALTAYQAERGWSKPEPRDLATSVTIEAAELLEYFQWSSLVDVAANRQGIADELADVLTYLVQLAIALDVDVAAAFFDKLERTKQKYPTTIFNPDSQPNSEAYRKLKAESRKGKVA
jgi:dCTP diphosphatase